jgi:hypothetical protein
VGTLEIIVIAVLLLVLSAVVAGVIKKKKKEKNNNPAQEVKPLPEVYRVDRLIVCDDIPRMLYTGRDVSPSGEFSGDANGGQDLVSSICVMLDKGIVPLAWGVTPTRSGRDTFLAETLIADFGLTIPVKYGASNNHMEQSELSNYIASESHKAPLAVTVSGTATDAAQALRQGANIANLTIIGTLYGTSNEVGDREAADIIKASGVRFINTGAHQYARWIKEMPREIAYSESAFIEKWRKVKTFNTAFSANVMQKASAENSIQFGHGLALRLSDTMNVMRYLSGDPFNDKSFLDYGHFMAAFERGLEKASKLTPVPRPNLDRAPNSSADFNKSKVNTLGFTNPFSFPVTSKLTRATVLIHRAIITHTKERTWERRQFSKGYVNSNLWLIYKHNGEWCALPYEYLRAGEGRKDKGFGVLNTHLVEGDQIGVMVSTLIRNGTANQKERSNIEWITI